ncbi:paralemmin-3 [Lepisosteus oculatus]|uniref:paralemmin-3 n=1 Tax=Lepisosteus oculatus TaxID=7918 RepID=UPI0035F52847
MDEAEKYQQRLQAIAEKRRIQEEQERARREMEEEKLRLQQMKRKSLRDQWLMEGPPLSPEVPSPRSPLWGLQAQQIEERIDKLQTESKRLAEEAANLDRAEGTPPQNDAGEAERTSTEKLKEGSSTTPHGSVSPEPPRPAPRVRKPNPDKEAPVENGQATRTVVSTVQVTLEKDLRTGVSTVQSVVPMATGDVQVRGQTLFDDGRKTVHAVGEAISAQPDPEEVGLVLSAVAGKAGMPEGLEASRTESTVIHNGGKDMQGKQKPEVPFLEEGSKEGSQSLHSSQNPQKVDVEGEPKTNGSVSATEVSGDENPEPSPATRAQENAPAERPGGQVPQGTAEITDQTGQGAITLTFLGFTEASPEEDFEEAAGTVIRAERVIITDEGDELSMDSEEERLKVSKSDELPKDAKQESLEGSSSLVELCKDKLLEDTKDDLEPPTSSKEQPQERPPTEEKVQTDSKVEKMQVPSSEVDLPVESKELPVEIQTAASQHPPITTPSSEAEPPHPPKSDMEPEKEGLDEGKTTDEKPALENHIDAAAQAAEPAEAQQAEQFQDIPLGGEGETALLPEAVKVEFPESSTAEKPQLQPLIKKGGDAPAGTTAKRQAPATPAEIEPLVAASTAAHNSATPSAAVARAEDGKAEGPEAPQPKHKSCQCCTVM